MDRKFDKLLELCGIEGLEKASDGVRLEETFRRIGLGSDDVIKAEKWVLAQHDINLLGIRKILKAWILELTDLVLARDEGKKVVYYGFPSIKGPGMSIKMAAPEDSIWIGCPDVVLCHTLGQIFNKLEPVLEAAESNGLPPGHALCSLQQIRNGAMSLGMIPVPDLVTGSSYFCDMGSKADELLHERFGHRAVYVDGSIDSPWGLFPECPEERIRFLGGQIDKLFSTVKEVLDIEVTSESMQKAILVESELFGALNELTMLMKADPVPVSTVATGLLIHLAGASTGRALSHGPDAARVLIEEVRQRVDKGIGVVPKGAPRVLSFIEHYSDPRITHMIEDSGLALGANLFNVPSHAPRTDIELKTLGEEIAAEGLRGGSYHSMFGLAQRFIDALETVDVSGVIWGYLFNCRPIAITSHLIKNLIERQTGTPVLALEMDIYDSRIYSVEALRTRVETFAQMLSMKQYG